MAHYSYRKVILSTELDRWFLHEEGAPVLQQEPWKWSLNFEITDIRLMSSLRVKNDYACGEERSLAIEKEIIVANLVPGRFSSEKYFVFGTDRPLSDIQLYIETIEDNQKESCIAGGHEGYVAGGNGDWSKNPDLQNKTTPYTLSFTLHINKSRFARYAFLVRNKVLDSASLRIGQTEGFYSWCFHGMSPDIIKVLPNGADHLVEMPKDCTIEPPRLGKIGEFDFEIRNVLKFAEFSGSEIDDAPNDKEKRSNPVQMVALADPKTINFLRSLRLSAWIILALLIFILLFKH